PPASGALLLLARRPRGRRDPRTATLRSAAPLRRGAALRRGTALRPSVSLRRTVSLRGSTISLRGSTISLRRRGAGFGGAALLWRDRLRLLGLPDGAAQEASEDAATRAIRIRVARLAATSSAAAGVERGGGGDRWSDRPLDEVLLADRPEVRRD